MRLPFITLVCLLFFGSCVRAQDSTVLELATLLQLVREHHPLAVQADLQTERANAIELMARGGFDPKAYGDLAQKYFEDKQYYSLLNGGVKVPTWYGLEAVASYENNGGVFRNPEDLTPDQGLYAVGLSANLVRGLFYDERRAALQRAAASRNLAAAERLLLLNDLLFSAGEAYWKWFEAYYSLDVQEEALQLATDRYAAIVEQARVGDRPAIDTLEAGIQVANRQVNRAEAQLKLANAAAQLAIFTWLDGRVPLDFLSTTRPPPLEAPVIIVDRPVDLINHPALNSTRAKIEQLTVDRRLAREQLKPQLSVKYNFITSGSDFVTEDLKWGVNFSSSLFLRKERGKLALTDVKLREEGLGLINKSVELEYKAAAARNVLSTTGNQLPRIRQIADDYRRLLAGERTLFRVGESSLFLVNSREQSYVGARLKSIKASAEVGRAALTLDYVLARL